jgi:hypothetical protein
VRRRDRLGRRRDRQVGREIVKEESQGAGETGRKDER